MAHNTLVKTKTVRLVVDERGRICVGPLAKGKNADGIVSLDAADVFSLMKFRCGDPMFPDDYARLDALRPGKPCPRQHVSELPAYAWNRRELGEQLGVRPDELEEIVSLPGCPTRRANGRWPTREVVRFLGDYMKAANEK